MILVQYPCKLGLGGGNFVPLSPIRLKQLVVHSIRSGCGLR